MRSYQPEILLGLILCLTAAAVVRLDASPAPQPPAVTVQAAAPVKEEASCDEATTVRLLRDGRTEELSLRDYLIGVVMSELPASFEPEALRAQAIASRTFALHCAKHEEANVCADSGCCQCWTDEQGLRERFGDGYAAFRAKAEEAVRSTDGQVVEYGGELIDATFFACSGGMTEDAVAVWGSSVPYLRPVVSPGEEQAQCYHTRTSCSAEEFAQAILAEAPEAKLTGDPAGWVGEAETSPGQGVAALEIGGVAFTGTALRRIFDLRSTRFTLCWDGEAFCFDTFGSGHRVGMSQYGAQAMAQSGMTAEQILKTYYTGVEIASVSKNK